MLNRILKQPGGKGILIYTGKTKYPLKEDIKLKPDFEAMNLVEVMDIVKRITLRN